ncbi:hypothetical protein EQM14_00595 [Caproiciproducens sp. NJN-50]|uniref:hypothetical protein n=1 Tax=Acutalibacteraceae TaxID=3082771 RepID=UPI000FFE24DB|nr:MULTISPECIES: hypothetical protein [Acutalibacteraceae]QAT48396.1 hypothetical protein EQM14_00595 [Caproiciproducens sp. NJN-50]
MVKFFKVLGWAVVLGSILLFLLAIKDLTFFQFLGMVLGLSLGLAFLAVGDLMERVSDLESRLDPPPMEPEEEDIQKVVCPNCYKKYGLDFPKCPDCGTQNSLW